jgi:mono/diheme cytochrome c family protein
MVNRICLLILSSFFVFSCENKKVIEKPEAVQEHRIVGFYEGMELYTDNCVICHSETGIPELPIFPPLKDSDYLRDNQDKIACVIKNGTKENLIVNGKTYQVKMNGFEHLSAQEVSQIINYINNSWGNENGTTSTDQVIKELQSCD